MAIEKLQSSKKILKNVLVTLAALPIKKLGIKFLEFGRGYDMDTQTITPAKNSHF